MSCKNICKIILGNKRLMKSIKRTESFWSIKKRSGIHSLSKPLSSFFNSNLKSQNLNKIISRIPHKILWPRVVQPKISRSSQAQHIRGVLILWIEHLFKLMIWQSIIPIQIISVHYQLGLLSSRVHPVQPKRFLDIWHCYQPRTRKIKQSKTIRKVEIMSLRQLFF